MCKPTILSPENRGFVNRCGTICQDQLPVTILLPVVIVHTLQMGSQTNTLTGRGVGGRFNWLLGGAIGGLAGAAIFGILLWLVDPTIVSESIPTLYGIEGGGPTGWAFHSVHGIVLGAAFGFLITRKPAMGTLTADVETPIIDSMGANARIVAAGLVYGLAIWTLFPVLILSVLMSFGDTAETLPWASIYTLVGHMLYGMLLGALVSVVTDIEIEVQESEAPFEEANNP